MVYWKVYTPGVALGVKVTLRLSGLIVGIPPVLDVTEVIVRKSPSGSESLPSTFIRIGVTEFVVAVSVPAVGAELVRKGVLGPDGSLPKRWRYSGDVMKILIMFATFV